MTNDERLNLLRSALEDLRSARDKVGDVGAPKALSAVRRAIRSLSGAIRHEENAPYREERQASKPGSAAQDWARAFPR